MVSNFFSHPKGLHPTPSACFPPCPPPKKPPKFTIELKIEPTAIIVGSQAEITYKACATPWNEPPEIDIHWITPGLLPHEFLPGMNCLERVERVNATFNLGDYVGTAVFKWPGWPSISRDFFYSVIMLPPPKP